jgi:hypothetical protein
MFSFCDWDGPNGFFFVVDYHSDGNPLTADFVDGHHLAMMIISKFMNKLEHKLEGEIHH